jgi:hypothetical protein
MSGAGKKDGATDRRMVGLVAFGALVLALVMAMAMSAAPKAEAATLTACVKKKTGEMRLVSGKKAKKKCPKGWRKVSWNSEGPGVVRDKNGKLVGKLLGVFPGGGTIYIVQRNGAQYFYLGSGEVFTIGGGSPSYTTPDCSGPAYLSNTASPAETANLLRVIGGPFRIVFRTTTGGFPTGPTRAWKSAGTFIPAVAVQTYELDPTSGLCVIDSVVNGNLINLTEVPAPPDFDGPLRLSWR